MQRDDAFGRGHTVQPDGGWSLVGSAHGRGLGEGSGSTSLEGQEGAEGVRLA